ncbi:uncharacterized protein N7459_001052 [Penicillium hispanicum]|uniref:uncharacterized protein n=1 Tax=Penicillium hispanicum TaxID=1080232 RepID=UPI00254200CC|nr:uncharacterized protein N7459_001052 [Penicillium hispanicum]KAJ5594844.1 hypothetical protein N7459_001052 [Penicillium hispanicum]
MPTLQELEANCKVVYLSETYSGVWLGPERHNTVVLPVLTPRGPVNNHNNVYLPMSCHPTLKRKYLPSRSFSAENPLAADTVVWVGMDLDIFMWKRSPRDFLLALRQAINLDRVIVTAVPENEQRHSRVFWMQMRGCFPNHSHVLLAAERHADLLKDLISTGLVSVVDEM